MRITDIKKQVSRPDRQSIFINNKYSFSLSILEVSRLKLYIGQELDKAQLSILKQEASLAEAKNKCFRLLSIRSRSKWELEDYLKRKDYNNETIEKVIKALSDIGYVDDYKFTETWVKNRLLLKHPSIRQLKQELRQKRIDNEIINEVLFKEDIDEVEIIRQLINKKREQSRYKDDMKLMQFLSRKGYSYGKIKEALNR